MSPVEKAIVSFFESVARKEKTRLQELQQERHFSLEWGRWCFTLPDLHTFLQQQDEVFRGIEYKRFRQLIFNTAINRTVKGYGAEITIAENRDKVDQTLYALVWHKND